MELNLIVAEGYLSCRHEDVLLLRCPYKEGLTKLVKPFRHTKALFMVPFSMNDSQLPAAKVPSPKLSIPHIAAMY